MSVDLLEKIRKVNSLLQRTGFQPVIFNDICKMLGDVIDANVMVISKKGKVLGLFQNEDMGMIKDLEETTIGSYLDKQLSNNFISVINTRENIEIESIGLQDQNELNKFKAVISPIDAGGEKLGTLFLYKNHIEFDVEDIIMVEYAATVVGLEIIRSINEESAEEIRKSTIVKSAIGTLSYSELEAILHIFEELDGMEGLLVASKIADRVGITRSVIVNALRKFESAGVIESRSLGMKGTYIKVLNEVLLDELDKMRR
ncbi:GTP-sensing pleiotropic transcriptional regulator CodY [Vallitalea okinawensis]|uniref:GTP-sensing pleiotropic transcriptional regulator CodY n=1 Tax=Vallitalea okinawensis TaxID=2078660 RepID=UPI000CFD41D6|nr:GTP-sensing pleiotropic transcriptional regulator CodY [Vallitalea okinawensis]